MLHRGERFAGPPEHNDAVRNPRSLCRVRHRCWARSTEIDGLVDMLSDEGLILPTTARMALVALVNQLKEFDSQIDAIECQLAQIQKVHPMAKLLASIPGVGPITATAVAATVSDPAMFRSGREFAAWLGTGQDRTPPEESRLGRITRRGDAYLRHLLVIGARNIVRYPRRDHESSGLDRSTT